MIQQSNSGKVPKLIAVLLLAFFLILSQAHVRAEINEDLVDKYLEREFDWGMFIKAQDLSKYLTYPGSHLNGLTKVTVNWRAFQRVSPNATSPASPYEQFWYHEERPIGLRRYRQLSLDPGKCGVIVIGDVSDNGVSAVANALLRLSVELAVKEAVTSVVLVPRIKYYQIASELGRFYMFPDIDVFEGSQFSIHLRSYPPGNDQYFFRHGHPQ